MDNTLLQRRHAEDTVEAQFPPPMDRFLITLFLLSCFLSPTTSLAGSTDTAVQTDNAAVVEEIFDALDAPILLDGPGGGGMGYPIPPMGGGVTIDVTYTTDVTPDFIGINAYCDSGPQPSREAARSLLNETYTRIKQAIGNDGKMRKSGSLTVSPFYDATGKTIEYSASISLFIRLVNIKAAERIADAVEQENCTVNWDARLIDTQTHELGILETLLSRLEKRKKIFEKLLRKRLTNVVGVTLNTWVDGCYYDTDTNSADANTTLSVTFSLSGRTQLQKGVQ